MSIQPYAGLLGPLRKMIRFGSRLEKTSGWGWRQSFAFLVAILVSTASTAVDATAANTRTIRGTVGQEHEADAPLLVWAMPLQTLDNGSVPRPSKQAIYRASQAAEMTTASNGRFKIAVTDGNYCVFAFADTNRNGRWDPAQPEAFGWHTTQAAGRSEVLNVDQIDVSGVDITLRAPRHFPRQDRSTAGGTLTRIKGYPVLQLRGDARSRGFSHGKLIAAQIVDFFRFYILEDKFGSAEQYENGFAKFLHSNFAYPEPFVTECKAVIEGMQASGEDLMIPELGREFSLTDLYAINGYIETRAMRSSCTQFAAWGPRTESTDVDGGMITGRNMDGEIDIRKVTVSHFLLFAVDPAEPDQKRYVSMMWPGFVATISGMNEDGFYTMENAGLTGPGGVVDRLVPIAWTMRESLAKLGADATPASVQRFVDRYDNAAGGVSGPGCIMLFATPYSGQQDPAFVFEGDRFGDAIRVASEVRPEIPNVLVCSNHHRKYGADPGRPGVVFDKTPSFSSRWRYEAGMHKLEAGHRTDQKIGTPQMRELLQTVAHGTTEYSIITRPNELEFDVSVASLDAELWDAPYRHWTSFSFDDVFEPAPAGADDSPKFAIAIHGGAGKAPSSDTWRTNRAKVLEHALSTGEAMLRSGKSSLDTVETVVRILENSPYFNAGKGAVFNAAGAHELDATIMDGRDRSTGAVGGVRTVKNPISLARRVMTHTPHVLLATAGADKFADEFAEDPMIERVPNDYFSTDYRRQKLEQTQRQQRQAIEDAMGTVGCVALDKDGNLAAATSTGGLNNKQFGRLGDSPIAGAGTYADNNTCAVSCTGIGEDFIRNAVAYDMTVRMGYRGDSAAKAASNILSDKQHRVRGGIIAVTHDGKIVMHFNTQGMARAAADSLGRHEVHVAE